jgi:tetratricopeptide (TPR) repeat protein
MGKLLATILIVVLSLAHIFSLGKVTEEAKRIPRDENSAYVIPAPLLKLTTFEFHGLISDYLFLKSLVFIGSTMERTERPRVKPWEWKWVYALIDAATDLDPYFFDPYYFANANFTWDGMMIQETNVLLEKGMRYRDWDSRLPFFIGFNYFYFLQDNTNARKYLLEASQRPDAPQIYAELASKLAYEKKRTENAISFLEEILRRTDDESLRKRYETRLSFLRAVLRVEKALEQYKKKYGREPSRIEDLIKKGLLREIPVDPSGGILYLDMTGRVRSTSEFHLNDLRQQD